MRISCTTGGTCASRTVVALGAIALLSMAASGADQVNVQARSVDPNRPVRAHGPGTIDLSRAGIPRMAYAATGSGVAEGVLPCTQPAGNCQLPDQGGHGEAGIIGATSDAVATFHVFEGFRNDDAGPMVITEVCWWGFYLDFDASADCGSEVPVDDFTITLFLNDPGCPTGAPDFAGPSQVTLVGNTAIKAPTGLLVGGNDEYEYSAQGLSIGPIPAGTCYWIGIRNNTPGTPSPNCLWLWSTSPGDGNSYQDGAADPFNDFDQAICLSMPFGDTTLCSEPPDDLCVGAEGECFEANATAGCNDECCCTVVCVDLPFCCISPWSQQCADAALSLGCTSLPPLPLCQDVVNCQVYTDLNAFNSTGDPGAAADLFHAADDFTVAAPGEITSLCFQGAYALAAVTDSFIVKVYDDVDGLPGSVIGTASQAGGTLTLNSRQDTNVEIIAGIPIWQYDATIDLGAGAGIPVVPDTCYWLEIVNNIGNVETWFWEWAGIGPHQADPTAGPRQGNGRCLVDGVGDGVTEPDGYDFFNDTAAGNDLAFCIGIALTAEACGFGDHGTETGPHEVVSFEGAATHLGWFSGDLDAGAGVDDQRRTAQPFTLPALPVGPNLAWSIEHLLLEGFDPGNVNEFINFEIFNRTALDVAPNVADSVLLLENVEFGNVFDLVTEEFGLIAQGLFLDPGDYWLTFWPSNSSGGLVAANVVWFTNAPNGINNVCTENMPPPAPGFEGCIPNDPGPNGDPAGSPAMLRSRLYPVPGFGAYTLDPSVLDLDPGDPTQDAADLYNTAFRLRMRAVEPPLPCPWDCGGDNDLDVGIVDFLALLGQWTMIDTSCDFDGGGVGIVDFLALLGNWGACP